MNTPCAISARLAGGLVLNLFSIAEWEDADPRAARGPVPEMEP
jgi:hypothetical protein